MVAEAGAYRANGPLPGGAIFSTAALRVLGFPPLLLDLEAVQDADHVIAVYRTDGYWGAIAKSNFWGLRCRAPVYRSLRELVRSYFENYINLRDERTLRAYSRPLNLARFDRAHPNWMTSDTHLWWIPEYLLDIPHPPILTPHSGATPLSGGPPLPPSCRRRPAGKLEQALAQAGAPLLQSLTPYTLLVPIRTIVHLACSTF
jgi:hypothetical protein